MNTGIKAKLEFDKDNNLLSIVRDNQDQSKDLSLGYIDSSIYEDDMDDQLYFSNQCNNVYIKLPIENKPEMLDKQGKTIEYALELQLYCEGKNTFGDSTENFYSSSILVKIKDETEAESSIFTNLSQDNTFNFDGLEQYYNSYSFIRGIYTYASQINYPKNSNDKCSIVGIYVVFANDYLIISQEKYDLLKKMIYNNINSTPSGNNKIAKDPKEVTGLTLNNNAYVRYFGSYNDA